MSSDQNQNSKNSKAAFGDCIGPTRSSTGKESTRSRNSRCRSVWATVAASLGRLAQRGGRLRRIHSRLKLRERIVGPDSPTRTARVQSKLSRTFEIVSRGSPIGDSRENAERQFRAVRRFFFLRHKLLVG